MASPNPAETKVLSLGQCAADGHAIARLIEGTFDATVIPAATLEEAKWLLERDHFALVLVNRILDANGASGLECVAHLKRGGAVPPIMLVSNHAGAQRDAQSLGAVPGFGKTALSAPQTLTCLTPYLRRRAVSP
jgi:hypothetical protein